VRQGRVQLVLTRSAARQSRPRSRRTLLIAGLLALALSGGARAEREPLLDAAELVDASLLAGPGWRVEPRVQVRGYQARFRIHTDWGQLEADSVDLLAVRVSEMPALEALHRTSVTQVLVESSAGRFGEPVGAITAIAGEPMRAGKGLPSGVARYFGERWERLRNGTRRVADRSHRLVMQDGSPYDDPSGPLGEAGTADPAPKRGFWQRRGRELGKLAQQEIGFPAARRALAERLALDPHTRNPLILPRLDGLAWVETSGRLATGEALGLLGGPAGQVLARAIQVNRLVLEAPPEQLRARNHAILADHCADERLLRGFLADGAYSPTLQVEFTDLYVKLAPAAGCEALLETALMAGDEAQARFVVNGLRLMLHALGEESRGGTFVPQGALLAYETTGGEFVLPLAVDWLAWTPQIRRWFDLPTVGNRPQRTLLVAGAISPRAESELTERGWSLVQRPPYPGAPPYRRGLDFAPVD
jgi:hypothetical protein